MDYVLQNTSSTFFYIFLNLILCHLIFILHITYFYFSLLVCVCVCLPKTLKFLKTTGDPVSAITG